MVTRLLVFVVGICLETPGKDFGMFSGIATTENRAWIPLWHCDPCSVFENIIILLHNL
jgi:hypothetical protein